MQNIKNKKFEFLEHTADIKFKAYGKSLNNLFENSALALSSYISRESKISSKIKKQIKIEGQDLESLLYRFLDELIYLLDAKNFLIAKAEVKIKNNKLKATIYGDNASNYKNLDHVKAATYAEMYVKLIKKYEWEAQVVVDV